MAQRKTFVAIYTHGRIGYEEGYYGTTRSKEELDATIEWLTGYDMKQVDQDMTYGDFFSHAPAMNPRAELIKGKVCGVQVETIEDPIMQKIRWLDKLVDELSKGKPLDKVLR